MTVGEGRYRAKRLLEKTGHVAIYLAEHEGAEVALYIADDPELDRTAFLRGVEALQRHPAGLPIARLLEAGECPEGVWAVTEHHAGRSWSETAEAKLPGPWIAPLLILEVAQGLATAVLAGLVHGALGPRCVVITPEGETKITNFGLSSLFGAPVGLEACFWAPEHFRRPLTVDARTDVYGFGVTLYRLFTASPPHATEDLDELRQCVLEKPLNLDVAEIPVPFRAVIARATAKDPDQRYSDVSELEVALLEALGERSSDLAVVGVWPESGTREAREAGASTQDASGPSTVRSSELASVAEAVSPLAARPVPRPESARPDAQNAPEAQRLAGSEPRTTDRPLGEAAGPAGPAPNASTRPRSGALPVAAALAAGMALVAAGAQLRGALQQQPTMIVVQAPSPVLPAPPPSPSAPVTHTPEAPPAPSPLDLPAPPAPIVSGRAPVARRVHSVSAQPSTTTSTTLPAATPPQPASSGNTKRFSWEISDPCALAWYRCSK